MDQPAAEQPPATPPPDERPAKNASPSPAFDSAPVLPVAAPGSATTIAAGGALALVASLLLYAWLAHVPSEHGWQLRRWSNPGFSGAPAVEKTVTEPFERELDTQPFSAEWQGWIRVSESRRYEFTLEADDEAALWIDEKQVLDERGQHARRDLVATVALEAGVHSVRIRLADFGGGKYLRLYFNTPDQSHGWMQTPFPRRMAWPTREAAEAAAPELSPSARSAWFGASVGLAVLGMALLLLARARAAGRAPGRRDVALGLAVVLVAFGVRAWGLQKADLHWDENAYLRSGMHHVRSLQLWDMEPQSFRWNKEHLPTSKWIYGFAELAGGVRGAKLFSAVLQALTCLLVFLLGRRYVSPGMGAAAGLMLGLMPYFVGHGRIIGLESTLSFFTMLAAWLLALACERQSWRLHLAWGFFSVLGIGARENGVWFGPVAVAYCVAAWVGGARRFRPYLAAVAGALLGVAAIALSWPWIWEQPWSQLQRSFNHWGYPTSEWVFGLNRPPPAWYYAFAFVVAVPTAIAALVLAWSASALRRHSRFDFLVALLLLVPFGHSVTSMRQDGARYVVQAFPALALAAAWGAQSLAGWFRRPGAGPWMQGAVVLYLAGLVGWMHPYELDYCAEWAGGPKGVMERRWLEIPFWGEGQQELADYVNAVAPPKATVRMKLLPIDDFPGLRPDLVRTESSNAEYLLLSFFQFPEVPRGYEELHAVRAGNATIAAVYRKQRAGKLLKGSRRPVEIPPEQQEPGALQE